MKIRCTTLFDISATGVRNHFNAARLPFTDTCGQNITCLLDWNHSRNQQRNWETLLQVLSLRSLPQDITDPVRHDTQPVTWQFEFLIENSASVGLGDDPVGALVSDSIDVPMISDLGESPGIEPRLIPGINVFYDVLEP